MTDAVRAQMVHGLEIEQWDQQNWRPGWNTSRDGSCEAGERSNQQQHKLSAITITCKQHNRKEGGTFEPTKCFTAANHQRTIELLFRQDSKRSSI